MRVGHVIGRVTLHRQDAAYRGGRFLLVQPLDSKTIAREELLPLTKGSTVVVYDHLGAGLGDKIGFSEGGEAAAPFPYDCPVDAYCCALLDGVTHTPKT